MMNSQDRRTFLKKSIAGLSGMAASRCLAASVAGSNEWATLRGRVVYDGTPPVPKRIVVTKDVDVCGKYDLVDESLTVNSASRGVKDVIVRLVLRRDETIRIHDSYQSDERAEVLLDNKCCRFAPHVTVLRTTQTLFIRNSDPKGDTIKIDARRNNPINVTLIHNQTHTVQYTNEERMPVRVSCGIHPWELGWLVISDHPYVAVTDKDGNFEMKNLPVGNHRFMFWQEKCGYVTDVTIGDEQVTWRRGMAELELRPGDNDLGPILVSPTLFDR